MGNEIFDRTERLLGKGIMDRLRDTKIILFGVGGVGSWCAEGLIRSGIGHLTMVDPDKVCATNVNRQLMATVRTVGQVKVEALRERLLEINPEADIRAVREVYSEQTWESFGLDSYDYIIDAVDSLKDKASLIVRACGMDAVFFSSMGAALKVDPTRVKTADFKEVKGCPLGAALRKKLKRMGAFPEKDFVCVYGDEVLPNLGGLSAEVEDAESALQGSKAVVNGSTASVTGIFGLTLSGLVIKDIYYRYSNFQV